MGKLTLKLVLVGLGFISGSALAQEAVTIADVRCILVGIRLSEMGNSPDQSKGALLTLYYMGRLDGRSPQLDLENLLIMESSKMTGSDYASEAKRCGASFVEKGEQISKVGRDMIERGKQSPR